jgi:hypothetical protein
VDEEHPRYCRHTVGRVLLATSGRGLCFDPHPSQGWGTRSHPRGSRGGNGIFTSKDFSLLPVRVTRHPIGTSSASTAPPKGTHSPYDVHETRTMGSMTIVKDATSVLKGQVRRHLEAPCVVLVSQGIFER